MVTVCENIECSAMMADAKIFEKDEWVTYRIAVSNRLGIPNGWQAFYWRPSETARFVGETRGYRNEDEALAAFYRAGFRLALESVKFFEKENDKIATVI